MTRNFLIWTKQLPSKQMTISSHLQQEQHLKEHTVPPV
jgi:hypothetical protein